jgi:hypothetical protein
MYLLCMGSSSWQLVSTPHDLLGKSRWVQVYALRYSTNAVYAFAFKPCPSK